MEKYLATELDAHLLELKEPLRLVRQQYGVDGDVTFRIRYSDQGEVMRVTIDDGPVNMPPAFISAANSVVLARLRVPKTGTAGELLFTDLGTETRTDAAAVNRRIDEQALMVIARQREERRRRSKKAAVFVVLGAIAWTVLQVLAQL